MLSDQPCWELLSVSHDGNYSSSKRTGRPRWRVDAEGSCETCWIPLATQEQHLELLHAVPTNKTSSVDAERWDVIDEPPGPAGGFLDLHSRLVQLKQDNSRWFVHQLVCGDQDGAPLIHEATNERKRSLVATPTSGSSKKMRNVLTIDSEKRLPEEASEAEAEVVAEVVAITPTATEEASGKKAEVVAGKIPVSEELAHPDCDAHKLSHRSDVVGVRVQVRFNSVLQTAKGPQTVDSWFLGHIDLFDSDQCRHHIKYDDGDQEWLQFPDDSVKFLRTGPLASMAESLNVLNSNQVAAQRKQTARPSTWSPVAPPLPVYQSSAKQVQRNLDYDEHLVTTAKYRMLWWVKLAKATLWPARITCPEEYLGCPAQTLNQLSQNPEHREIVFFFGSRDWACVERINCHHWTAQDIETTNIPAQARQDALEWQSQGCKNLILDEETRNVEVISSNDELVIERIIAKDCGRAMFLVLWQDGDICWEECSTNFNVADRAHVQLFEISIATAAKSRKWLVRDDASSIASLNQFLLNLINLLCSTPAFASFVCPVDTRDLPDYKSIIRKPLCLLDLQTTAINHGYTKVADFEADVAQIRCNAHLYCANKFAYVLPLADQLNKMAQKKLTFLFFEGQIADKIVLPTSSALQPTLQPTSSHVAAETDCSLVLSAPPVLGPFLNEASPPPTKDLSTVDHVLPSPSAAPTDQSALPVLHMLTNTDGSFCGVNKFDDNWQARIGAKIIGTFQSAEEAAQSRAIHAAGHAAAASCPTGFKFIRTPLSCASLSAIRPAPEVANTIGSEVCLLDNLQHTCCLVELATRRRSPLNLKVVYENRHLHAVDLFGSPTCRPWHNSQLLTVIYCDALDVCGGKVGRQQGEDGGGLSTHFLIDFLASSCVHSFPECFDHHTLCLIRNPQFEEERAVLRSIGRLLCNFLFRKLVFEEFEHDVFLSPFPSYIFDFLACGMDGTVFRTVETALLALSEFNLELSRELRKLLTCPDDELVSLKLEVLDLVGSDFEGKYLAGQFVNKDNRQVAVLDTCRWWLLESRRVGMEEVRSAFFAFDDPHKQALQSALRLLGGERLHCFLCGRASVVEPAHVLSALVAGDGWDAMGMKAYNELRKIVGCMKTTELQSFLKFCISSSNVSAGVKILVLPDASKGVWPVSSTCAKTLTIPTSPNSKYSLQTMLQIASSTAEEIGFQRT